MNATPGQNNRQSPDNTIYSDIPEIEYRLLTILPKVLTSGYPLEDHRPIPYGVRLLFRSDTGTIGVNVYYSKKKGHSTVFDAGLPQKTVKALRELFDPHSAAASISPIEKERAYATWIGCDESGKGAFTGPLVAAAYFCDRDHAEILAGLGVLDSKRLDSRSVRRLATSLRKYASRISVLELKPETYNRLYADFRAQNRSLNDLLAWAHGKAVEKLLLKKPGAVIVDQFANAGLIRSRMPANVPDMIIRPKAENNIAVAAASIVAAGRYLEALDNLSETCGVTIRPGAGADADRSVQEAMAVHGPDILPRLVKTHFKNMHKINTIPGV
jgi:ribonuclease HIII